MRALERFTQMAVDNDIFDKQEITQTSLRRMGDTYLEGIKALQREIRRKPAELGRFVLHFPLYEDQDNNPSDFEEEEDENLLSSSLIESDHNSHNQATQKRIASSIRGRR
ncbi:hypothetical protein MJO29_007554 [Puccinia striiformis f. sp. tritici]|nr:hypothetical protein MJO29_007554 [Puccinia striiformis f. sp. tritici]